MEVKDTWSSGGTACEEIDKLGGAIRFDEDDVFIIIIGLCYIAHLMGGFSKKVIVPIKEI